MERARKADILADPVSAGGEMRLLRGRRLALRFSLCSFRGRLKTGHVFSRQSLRAAVLLGSAKRRVVSELKFSFQALFSESLPSLVSAAMFTPRKKKTPNQSLEPTAGLRPAVAHL